MKRLSMKLLTGMRDCVCGKQRKDTQLQQNSDKLNLVIVPKDEELTTMGAVNLNSLV